MRAASLKGESFFPSKMLQLVHFDEILICSDYVWGPNLHRPHSSKAMAELELTR
jgi:hypothetical protein